MLRLIYPFAVLRVDHEHETLGAGVVVPPERTNLVLSSDIPYVELDILVRDRLDVETNCTYLDRR